MYNPQITVERITILRNEKNISLNSLNEACNLNKNTIKMSESSKNGLSSAFLYDIANYLDCSADYLLGRTDNPNLTNSISNTNTTVNGTQANVIHNQQSTLSQKSESTEMEKEISSILSGMSYRERTELMCLIYKFVDEHNT